MILSDEVELPFQEFLQWETWRDFSLIPKKSQCKIGFGISFAVNIEFII